MIESLDWLRPVWLLAIPAGIAVAWAWWQARIGAGPWRAHVDPELLAQLVGRAPAGGARLVLGLGFALLVLVCAALAGPTWRAQPASTHAVASARIVVLDLSPSMDAIDVAPSRLERARAAVATLLRDAAGAQLGLVVFGADAFSVAPLTNDAAPLVHLLAGLATATVPRSGSRPDLGLDMARALLEQAHIEAADVILVGDSADEERTIAAARALAEAGIPVSVLAVGSGLGGPVRLAGGALARTEAGEILIARPDFAALERVAQAGGGRFHLLPPTGVAPRFERGAQAWVAARSGPASAMGQQQDDGAWLALLGLPMAALLFRRGWLAALALAVALPVPQAHAFDWMDLWRRADQQAAAAFAEAGRGEHAQLAVKLGRGSPWHALLLYRGGRYAEAAEQFARHDTADAHYNRGNALALDGRLDAAIDAYDAALERRPAMRDAQFNRALVREAMASRGPQAHSGAQGSSPEGADASSVSAGRSRGAASGRGAAAGRNARDADWDEPGAPKPPQARDANAGSSARQDEVDKRSAGAPEAVEQQRLERLLAKVPDEPGSLLANRFAWQLRQRGVPHRDTGGRW